MPKLSVCIIARDEEANIERCLRSVSWAEEIVVVDSGSVDGTVDICMKYRCRLVETEWLGFGRTKRLAADSASNDWILSIDADEEVTERLRESILGILRSPEYNGYRIKRRSFYLGREIRHCGWGNDSPLRLFNRNYGNFNDSIIHERVILSGPEGRIDGPLLHYTYPDLASHVDRINRYSTLGAKEAFSRGKRSSMCGALVRGFLKFVKMYFIQLGILDGLHGLLLSVNSGYGIYLKYIKLRDLNRSKGSGSGN